MLQEIILSANVLLAGSVGALSLFRARGLVNPVFENAEATSEATRICGCFWLAIAIASLLGLFNPEKYGPVLLIQLVYKGSYLLFSYLPQRLRGETKLPYGIALFFAIWVLVLPFAIDWQSLL